MSGRKKRALLAVGRACRLLLTLSHVSGFGLSHRLPHKARQPLPNAICFPPSFFSGPPNQSRVSTRFQSARGASDNAEKKKLSENDKRNSNKRASIYLKRVM
jgi:hypothetical protein